MSRNTKLYNYKKKGEIDRRNIKNGREKDKKNSGKEN